MPRPLTNYEWASFLAAIPICPYDQSDEANAQAFCTNKLVIPPWGAVVEWSGLEVLVFLGAMRDFPDVNVYGVREVFLTEISDLDPSWKQQVAPQFVQWADAFWYSLPASVGTTLQAAAGTASSVAVGTAGLVGEIVGGALNPIVQPTLQSLALPLAIAALAFLLLYLPKPK